MNGRLAIQLRGISKSFGAVRALNQVDLELRPGEILGVVGDNGAGKTSLMKIVSGVLRPDAGDIRVGGEPVVIQDPEHARRLGIEMIYQDLALFDNLDVASNIFIGREHLKGWLGLRFLDKKRMHQESFALLQRLKIRLPSTKSLVAGLSGGQRQMVAISRALAFEAGTSVLIMDEPHAALGVAEAATVSDMIRGLRGSSLSLMIISHRIPELLSIVDRVLVLKRGERAALLDASGCTVEECERLIVAGRQRTGMDSSSQPSGAGA